MGKQDRASINTSGTDESSYKMSSRQTAYFVKLRVSNSLSFSGKKETSMSAWRAILKHMNLQDKMSVHQAEEQWENMKKKYQDTKHPPQGVPVFSDTCPYFSLMDDAMEGRLEGSAPVLNVSTSQHDWASSSVTGEEGNEAAAVKNRLLEQEGALMEREKAMMEREKAMMEREKAMVEREKMMMEREKAMMEREKLMMEREEATMARERAATERTMWFD